jgi:hypothetical protein
VIFTSVILTGAVEDLAEASTASAWMLESEEALGRDSVTAAGVSADLVEDSPDVFRTLILEARMDLMAAKACSAKALAGPLLLFFDQLHDLRKGQRRLVEAYGQKNTSSLPPSAEVTGSPPNARVARRYSLVKGKRYRRTTQKDQTHAVEQESRL